MIYDISDYRVGEDDDLTVVDDILRQAVVEVSKVGHYLLEIEVVWIDDETFTINYELENK